MECPGRESQKLGFTDVATAELRLQCAENNRSMFHIRFNNVLFPKLMNVSRSILSMARDDK
jgi:hypothetical protein